jgi:hypothetical protein
MNNNYQFSYDTSLPPIPRLIRQVATYIPSSYDIYFTDNNIIEIADNDSDDDNNINSKNINNNDDKTKSKK